MANHRPTLTPMLSLPPPWVAIGVSTLALLVSGSALCVTVLSYRRDRAALKVTSSYIEHADDCYAAVQIKIVNVGRRSILLRIWVGAETKKRWFRRRKYIGGMASYFGTVEGMSLGEQQVHSLTFENNDLYASGSEDQFYEFDEVWIEDTLGRRHHVKDIRANIAKLRSFRARS